MIGAIVVGDGRPAPTGGQPISLPRDVDHHAGTFETTSDWRVEPDRDEETAPALAPAAEAAAVEGGMSPLAWVAIGLLGGATIAGGTAMLIRRARGSQ
jgi:hypothetical protein